jgi:Domain of unknown function (DUF4926)
VISELGVVRLRADQVLGIDRYVSEADWRPRPGELGTIVLVHEPGVYEVEFVNDDGSTRALVTVSEEQVELVRSP